MDRNQAIEMLLAELAIGHAVAQHVIRGDQQAVADGDDRSLLATAARQPPVWPAE